MAQCALAEALLYALQCARKATLMAACREAPRQVRRDVMSVEARGWPLCFLGSVLSGIC